MGSNMENKTVEIKKDGIYLDNAKFFLLSGDMHYFRCQPDGWYRRLFLMKDFGLTAVTTYVPWNLTEPKPNQYNFEPLISSDFPNSKVFQIRHICLHHRNK